MAAEMTDMGKLEKIPQWCGDDTKHINNPKYQGDYCCINHVIGLPKHRLTGQPTPLAPYQIDFLKKTERRKPGHKMYHLNKGRQMGFTEIVLRKILYECFHAYKGRKVGIIAATTGALARKDLQRLYNLFKQIPEVLDGKLTNNCIKLKNGTIIEAFSAHEESMTGDTNYACVFMDEAAKWRLQDDKPVINSIFPIVRSNGSDLFLVSTPKGPIKTFYHIHKEPGEFIKLFYDIWATEGNLYTRPEIEKMIRDSTEDPNQEYLGKFVIGKSSIFGLISDENREDYDEWDLGGNDEEDDNYIMSPDEWEK